MKTAIVTGATSGLGEAAAEALGKAGWEVVLVGRDEARGAAAAQRVNEAGGKGVFVRADLFSVAGVKQLGAELSARYPRIELLVNNAGGAFGGRELTSDGVERTFALNVLTPYTLTDALMGSLAATKGRVVNVATAIPNGQKTTVDAVAADASGFMGYSKAKLALVALTLEQQKRLGPKGVTVVSMHPGVIPGTRFGVGVIPAPIRSFSNFMMKLTGFGVTLDEAAARYVAAGTGAVEPGGYYKGGKLTPPPVLAGEPAFREGLWDKLTSLHAAH